MPDLPHVISPSDLPDHARDVVLGRARWLKQRDPDPIPNKLRVGALYFDPSLRTRASFEQAVRVVGGACQSLNAGADTWALELDPNAVMDGTAVENIAEAARVLGRFFHLLGVRSFRGTGPWAVERTEPVLKRISDYAGVPVVSLEGATHHPCQGLADALTLRETFGEGVKGLPVTLCWAWHPKQLPQAVPHTFLLQAALEGCDVAVAHPEGWDLDAGIVAEATAAAEARGGRVTVTNDRAEALKDRRVVYVKSWGPLGGTGPTPAELRHWLVDEASLKATDDAKVMHCLPVRRNVVITGDVLEGPRSLVIQQAGNRLWAQAGLVEHLARVQGVIG